MWKVYIYANDISPLCRSVLMVAKEIRLKYEMKPINLDKQEHLTEDFLNVNPLHTIPVLYDHGFVLADSHAIACYLVDDFSHIIRLYPKEMQKRALVAQYLMFEATVMFPSIKRIVLSILFGKEFTITKEDIDACKEAFSKLNTLLEGKTWLIRDYAHYTIADISCVATASSASILVDMDEYPNVKTWMKRCEQGIPSYNEFNVPGLKKLHALMSAALPSAAVPSAAVPSATDPSAADTSAADPSAAVPSATVPSAALPSDALPSS